VSLMQFAKPSPFSEASKLHADADSSKYVEGMCETAKVIYAECAVAEVSSFSRD